MKNHDSKQRNILPDELNILYLLCKCVSLSKKEDIHVFDDLHSMLIYSNDCIVFQFNEKSLHKQSNIFKLGISLFL